MIVIQGKVINQKKIASYRDMSGPVRTAAVKMRGTGSRRELTEGDLNNVSGWNPKSWPSEDLLGHSKAYS